MNMNLFVALIIANTISVVCAMIPFMEITFVMGCRGCRACSMY